MTELRSPVLTALAGLDPAAGRPLVVGRPDDAELLAILATPRPEPVPAERRVPRPVLAGAAAAALVATGVLVGTLVWEPTTAYASWTAEPAVVSDVQDALRADACPAVAQAIVGGATPEVVDVPLETVLVDVRGQYAYVLHAAESAVAECFVTQEPGGTQWEAVGNDLVLGEGETLAEPAADGLTVLGNGTSRWAEGVMGEGAVTSAYGRVGADVESVVVTTTGGDEATASVENGWWAVWAPGGDALEDTARLTLDDGRVLEVSVSAQGAGTG
ncbi:hypothetical protein [Actinotalea subterranea]|uniref:hypothetical protein n=1 Tax=Actinotalea subterranea TaxID=2607497 RepID=UPI0011EE04BE|nr:hypothetical protein [Actinotalea subterranea]